MSTLRPEWIDPKRTALVPIDMQVDFGAPDGMLGKLGLDMTAPLAAVAQSEKLAAAARAAGVPLVFVGLQTRRSWIRRTGRSACAGWVEMPTAIVVFAVKVPPARNSSGPNRFQAKP